MLEIRHLKLIKAIVEEGSLSQAIHQLHLTQSALSHQLKEAEYQLGTKIFDRQGKKLVLTAAGKKLYPVAKEVIEKLQTAENDVRQLVSGETGEIRISTECYSSYHWLPAVLKQFRSIYPQVEVKLVVEATHYPLQKLLANVIDLAIVSDTIKDDRLSYLELFQDEVMMLVSSSHPWAQKKFVTADDFVEEHLLIHSLPLETVTVYQLLLAPSNIMPRKITPIPLTEASMEMVKANMGVMSMAKWALQPYLSGDELSAVKIGRSGLKRKHYIATMSGKAYPAYFKHFLEFLKTEISSQWST